jgi:hypothetical protein
MTGDRFIELTTSRQRNLPEATIATLGPAGTSSEIAAGVLADRLARPGVDRARVRLFDTYEQAGAALLAGHAEFVVLANAYALASQFYMNPRLCLAAAFVHDTPEYGLAAGPASPASGPVSVATHSAPEPLIHQLMPPAYRASAVVKVDSTSHAAAAVRAGTVDLALTTAPAAEHHGLGFVSATRTIRMLWSAFTRLDLVGEERTDAASRS